MSRIARAGEAGAEGLRDGFALRAGALLPLALCALLVALLPYNALAANISSNQTGNWDVTSTWVGGVVPVAGDNVTIASGHVVTVAVNAAAATITVSANGGASNGITINSGILLNVSGAITMTAPTVASSSTIAVGDGTLQAASIAIPGSGTASRNCIVSVNAGTITTTGSITFSGSAARAQFTSTGASTVNVAGNFGSGGTLTTSATGTINFNGGGAETIGTYTTYNNITINNTSGGVTLTGTTTFGGTLGVQTGTLTVGAFTLTVTGATTVGSTLTISSTTGTKTFGDITINNGGTMSFTAAEDIACNGSLTANGTGTISGSAGTWTFQKAGGGGTIGGTASSISLTNATFTTSYTLGTGISTTNLTLTTGTFDAASYALTISGNFTDNATFTPSTSAITMSGANKTISGSSSPSFYDLTASGSITAAVAVGINHNLTVNSGGTFNASTFAVTGSGTNTLTVSGTLGAGAATFGTNYVSFETTTLNTGSTIDYTGAGAQTVDNTLSYLSLAHSGTGTATSGGNLTIAENLTISAGTLDLSTFTANRTTSGGTLTTSGTGTLKIGGTNGIPSNYSTHTFTAGMIEYGGTNQTVSVETYFSLAISGSGTKTMAGTTTLNGNLTLTASTFSTSGSNYNLTVKGNWTNNGGTFSAGTNTVTFTAAGKTIGGTSSTTFATIYVQGTSTLSMSNDNTCSALTINAGNDTNPCSFTQTGTSALTVNGNVTVAKFDDMSATWNINAGSATVTGNVTITDNSNVVAGISKIVITTGTLTVQGNLTFTDSFTAPLALIDMSGGAGTLNLAGSLTVNTVGTLTPGTSSTVNFNGTAAGQTVTLSSAITYCNLYLNNTNASGATLGAAVTSSNVTGDLRVQSGTLSNGGFAVDGNAGKTFQAASGATYKMTSTTGMVTGFGTKTFGATSTANYAGTNQTVSNEAYGHLTLSGSGTKTMPGSTMTLAGDFTMSGTCVATAAAAVNTTGNFTIGTNNTFTTGSLSHDLKGNFTDNGTFTSTGSTFTFTGTSAQSIGGTSSPTFENVTLSGTAAVTTAVAVTVNTNLTVGSGCTFTVAGFNITVTGSTSVTGTLAHSSATGAKTYVGLVTLNTNGSWTNAGNSNITLRGGIAHNGTTFTSGSGTYTFDTNAQAVGGTSALSIDNVTVTGVTLTNNSSSFTVPTALSGTGGLTQGTNTTLFIGGTSGITTLIATASGNTVNFSGGAQTVKGVTYWHLTLSGSGAKTMPGSALAINGSFATSGTASATAASAMTVAADVTLGSGTTFNAGAFGHGVGGNWSNNGATFTASGSTITLNGTAAQAIGGSASSSFNNLTDANTSATVSATVNFDVSGTCTVNASALLSPGASVVINSGAPAGTITGSGTVQVTRTAATADYSSQCRFTTNTLTNLTVEYAGAAAQTISALTYGGLKMNNSSGTTLAGDATIGGTLTLASGVITTGASSVIISSTGSVSRTSGHVFGNLQRYVASGSNVSLSYTIGDATNYTPVDLVFASVSVAGSLTAATTAGDHPNIGTSDIAPSTSVNRYWTLTNGSVTFTNFNATFTFVAGDVDAGANTANFVARRWNGSAWSNATAGTHTSTSTQITGQATTGDFQLGCVLSVATSNNLFAFGSQPLNAWLSPQSAVITNDGVGTEDIVAQISTLTAGANSWTLSSGANGADQIRAQWSTTSSSGPWTDISAYNNNFTIGTSLGASGTLTLYLRIQTPTSTASASQYSSTLTVTAQ